MFATSPKSLSVLFCVPTVSGSHVTLPARVRSHVRDDLHIVLHPHAAERHGDAGAACPGRRETHERVSHLDPARAAGARHGEVAGRRARRPLDVGCVAEAVPPGWAKRSQPDVLLWVAPRRPSRGLHCVCTAYALPMHCLCTAGLTRLQLGSEPRSAVRKREGASSSRWSALPLPAQRV